MAEKRKKGQHYPKEIKQVVLRRVRDGEAVADIAEEMEIHHSTIYAWMKSPKVRAKRTPIRKPRKKKIDAQLINKGTFVAFPVECLKHVKFDEDFNANNLKFMELI